MGDDLEKQKNLDRGAATTTKTLVLTTKRKNLIQITDTINRKGTNLVAINGGELWNLTKGAHCKLAATAESPPKVSFRLGFFLLNFFFFSAFAWEISIEWERYGWESYFRSKVWKNNFGWSLWERRDGERVSVRRAWSRERGRFEENEETGENLREWILSVSRNVSFPIFF